MESVYATIEELIQRRDDIYYMNYKCIYKIVCHHPSVYILFIENSSIPQ
jgi:hypothetical protein